MYGICSTKKGDVKACVKAMAKAEYDFPIYQLDRKTYAKLEKDRSLVPDVIRKKVPRHSVDVQRCILHRKMCKKITVQNSVVAAISRPALTGLRMCSCMK